MVLVTTIPMRGMGLSRWMSRGITGLAIVQGRIWNSNVLKPESSLSRACGYLSIPRVGVSSSTLKPGSLSSVRELLLPCGTSIFRPSIMVPRGCDCNKGTFRITGCTIVQSRESLEVASSLQLSPLLGLASARAYSLRCLLRFRVPS
jgi:hypothetical protein